MTDPASHTPASPAGHGQLLAQALTEAREYLAATVEKVHPGLSASSLLRYANEYRAHLATLVGACSKQATDTTRD